MVVVLCQVAAACLIGLLLPHVTDLAEAVRTEQGVSTGEVELGKTFNDDGWLIALGGAAGLVLGLTLQVWRRTHEVVTVVAIAVSSFGAAHLAGWIAEATGPGDVAGALAEAEIGATASVPVVIDSEVAYLVWPLCATLAALVALLSSTSERSREPVSDAPSR